MASSLFLVAAELTFYPLNRLADSVVVLVNLILSRTATSASPFQATYRRIQIAELIF